MYLCVVAVITRGVRANNFSYEVMKHTLELGPYCRFPARRSRIPDGVEVLALSSD